ncbi:TBPIP-domain-containing protein [Gautieria morchelliformis]|nr:TBPIP-domain-containing protein [Gautieria morchelliformis]
MPGKDKEAAEKVPVLKGPAAEKKLLDYVNEMNRPFGAADIFANLKGAVAKASVQKILVALAEKGEITQKAYAKTLVFVAKQGELDEMPVETWEALESEERQLVEDNRAMSVEIKGLTQGQNSPTNEELEGLLREAGQTLFSLHQQLQPLRSGQSLVTVEDLAHLDAEWQKWRALWVERRKVFHNLRSIATDAMVPQQCQDLDEDLGIEYDTPEHNTLENSPLCKPLVKARR